MTDDAIATPTSGPGAVDGALADERRGSPLPIDRRLLRQCVQCGLCLDACPTYRLLGLEADSPRGRIFQMHQVADGQVAPSDPNFRRHIYACLDCRACQTACPSGVQYGRLIEGARAVAPPPGLAERVGARVLLGKVLVAKPLLGLAGVALRLASYAGLPGLVAQLAGSGVASPGLADLAGLLGAVQGPVVRRRLPELTPALGERQRRVGLLSGCVMDELLPETNRRTVRLLARHGCEVATPGRQGCCGALHLHAGQRQAARALARHNVAVFERAGVEAVVVNAAGCGSALKEYGELLADDPAYAERARRFASSVRDVSEYLAELGLDARGLGEVRQRVTYQDPCHLAHGQGIRQAPRQLLRAVPGLEFVELPESDTCCGSAGIYNLTHPELARQLLEWKLDQLQTTGAEVVVAPNPGCMFQLAAGIRRRGLDIEVVHLVDLLDRAYEGGGTLPPAPVVR